MLYFSVNSLSLKKSYLITAVLLSVKRFKSTFSFPLLLKDVVAKHSAIISPSVDSILYPGLFPKLTTNVYLDKFLIALYVKYNTAYTYYIFCCQTAKTPLSHDKNRGSIPLQTLCKNQSSISKFYVNYIPLRTKELYFFLK